MTGNKVSLFSYKGEPSGLRRTITHLLKPLASVSPLADPERSVPHIVQWMDAFHAGLISPDPADTTLISQAMTELGMTPTGYVAEELIIYLIPGDWRVYVQHHGKPDVVEALESSGHFSFVRELHEGIVALNSNYKQVFLRDSEQSSRGIQTRSQKQARLQSSPEAFAQTVADWLSGLNANDHEELIDQRAEALTLLLMGAIAGELQRADELPSINHQAPDSITSKIIPELWDYTCADLLEVPAHATQQLRSVTASLESTSSTPFTKD